MYILDCSLKNIFTILIAAGAEPKSDVDISSILGTSVWPSNYVTLDTLAARTLHWQRWSKH